MGGDRSPLTILEGASAALPQLKGPLVLIGDKARVEPLLKKRRLAKLKAAIGNQVSLVHTDETIEMHDTIKAVRAKPEASINVGMKMAAADFEASLTSTSAPSAFISTGHSGAMMASALMQMGRIKGIERPAIAVTLPTLSAHGCVLLDVGANVDCKPEHIRDFAIMGALFAKPAVGDRLPKVGILSNGEEKSKGNEQARATLALLEAMPGFSEIGQFSGFVEGKEIFKGQVDVVATDGFVGNVVLKAVEGLGSAIVHLLKAEAKSSPFNILGFLIASGAIRGLKKKLDYAEYGAAPLLGVEGYAFICHGRSNSKAIKNALLRAQTSLESQYVERLKASIARIHHD